METDLYRSLQVVLIEATAAEAQTILLHGQGSARPFEYKEALRKVLGSSRFMSTLYFRPQYGRRYGCFIISSGSDGKSRPLNQLVKANLGLDIRGNIVIASAERCGKNQFLYELGPICPLSAQSLLRGHINRRQHSANCGNESQRDLRIGVSVSVNEAFREWWEDFVTLKKGMVETLDQFTDTYGTPHVHVKKSTDENTCSDGQEPATVSRELYEFLTGSVSVWCSLCGNKYSQLRLCRTCQCVAFCRRRCWNQGVEGHQRICPILCGEGNGSVIDNERDRDAIRE